MNTRTRTSDEAHELGLYTSGCCGEELIFDLKDTFTRCPKCERLCTWELEETLVSPSELEPVQRKAA
jgi:hypothetical protein